MHIHTNITTATRLQKLKTLVGTLPVVTVNKCMGECKVEHFAVLYKPVVLLFSIPAYCPDTRLQLQPLISLHILLSTRLEQSFEAHLCKLLCGPHFLCADMLLCY